mgnify:CR=1
MRWDESRWCSQRLPQLREEIKETDCRILELVKMRMSISEEIGEIKMASGLPICDPIQETRVIETRLKRGHALGLKDDFVEELMVLLMKNSKRTQQQHIGFEESASDIEVSENVTLAGK